MISSLILFFLGFIYSYYFYKDGQKNHEITIGSDRTFRKENILYYYVWNSGKSTIYKEDLINESGCLEVHFKDGTSIEYVKITEKTSDHFKTNILHNYNNIKIDFDFLRPDEGFTLMLKLIGVPKSYWNFQIKQKKDAINFPRTLKARGVMSNLYLANNIFSFVFLSLAVGVTLSMGKIDLMNLNGWLEYYTAFSNLLILGFLIYATPLLFRRIKASRPPKELKLHFVEKNLGKST